MRWNLSYTYLELPEVFYATQSAAPVPEPRLGVFNHALADELGLQSPDEADVAILGGNAPPPGGRPFAQAYAGHQYGRFTMLGDGRALVLGEHVGPDGQRRDLQLKGSGPTPYSRSGDGKASLGPMLREFLLGEAMHALGVPTTRGLAVVETGQSVQRGVDLPGAVLTRVARSHLRVGTFEFAAATGELESLRSLTDYAIARHYPQAAGAAQPALGFLGAVLEAQARLVAQWMSLGFVHGVMNTDNVAISGETIDYGPCAFLDAYRPQQAFSSIDRHGRYAYANQPAIAGWNVARLAQSLVPLLHPDPSEGLALAQALVDSFPGRYESHYLALMGRKLGLSGSEGVREVLDPLLARMEETGADYTLTFRSLADTAAMAATNPVCIPRNLWVEHALEAAVGGDYGPFHRLLAAVRSPFSLRPGDEEFASPPQLGNDAGPYVTYCGT